LAGPVSDQSGHPVRTAVLLAGERPGGNALARAFGVTSSLTLDLLGRPVIDWTLTALSRSTLERLVVVGPGEEAMRNDVVESWLERPDVERTTPAPGPAASALRGTESAGEWPLLLTAADHALLTADSVDGFCASATLVAQSQQADLVVGLVEHAPVAERFPGSKRTILKFSDGWFCGSNLFLLVNKNSQNALRLWSQLEALRKQPWRLAHGIGWGVCLRYLVGRLSVADAFAALSRRSGAVVRFCPLREPTLAVDVDSLADLQLASDVLASMQKEVP